MYTLTFLYLTILHPNSLLLNTAPVDPRQERMASRAWWIQDSKHETYVDMEKMDGKMLGYLQSMEV